MSFTSHSVWSAWIEIYNTNHPTEFVIPSHSVWSAWIEIKMGDGAKKLENSRTLYGVRGLKCCIRDVGMGATRRTLYGVRGLK